VSKRQASKVTHTVSLAGVIFRLEVLGLLTAAVRVLAAVSVVEREAMHIID
jgi:hypothetical protein